MGHITIDLFLFISDVPPSTDRPPATTSSTQDTPIARSYPEATVVLLDPVDGRTTLPSIADEGGGVDELGHEYNPGNTSTEDDGIEAIVPYMAPWTTAAPKVTTVGGEDWPEEWNARFPEAQHWYVSTDARRNASCRHQDQPCRSLGHVMSKAGNGDVIHVEGGNPDKDGEPDYNLCDSETGEFWHYFDKSILLEGTKGRPTITCNIPYADSSAPAGNETTDTLEVNRKAFPSNQSLEVRLSGLHFVDTILVFASESKVHIHDVIFRNASVESANVCRNIAIYISSSHWYGTQTCREDGICTNRKVNNITSLNTLVHITLSQLYQTTFIVESHRTTNLKVTHSIFSNNPDQLRFLGGLHFTFSAFHGDIWIFNNTFEGLVHPTKVQSVINLFDAAIWLKSTAFGHGNDTSYVEAFIDRCRFINNERGITVVGPFKALEIRNSLFQDNMAMHAGGAILVLIEKTSHLGVVNTQFISNKAGKYRNDYPIDEVLGAFQEVGTEVHLNANCCTGVISLVGKGGAIRNQRGNLTLDGCTFKNNSARLLGGSVFVDIDGELLVVNTTFENTPQHDHALQGDILYSDGKMTINQVVLKVNTARNGLSILRHSGNHWSLDITNAYMNCPVGYNLRATNASAYGVRDTGLIRSYKLDQLSYFCESCPRNKYSLDYGYLNYTMVFSGFAYFTLLINGSVPEPQYTGKYIHHEIECEDCPYGGHCVQGITCVPNFWGHTYQNRAVRFQHCPKSYCCSSPGCPNINTCMDKREGILCGRCQNGYSEAIFSPLCIQNEKCGPFWVWPMGIAAGILYTFFLMFQVDLKNFLFSQPLVCMSLCKKKKQNKPANGKPCMNGRLQTSDTPSKQEPDNYISNGIDMEEFRELRDSGFGTLIDNNHTDNFPEETASNDEIIDDRTDLPQFKAADSGFLIIVFYYFQDALLLHVKTVHTTIESETEQLMKSLLSGLFKLQLDLFEMINEVCIKPDMSAVPNMLAKAMIVPYVIFIFFVCYVFYRWLMSMKCGRGAKTGTQGSKKKTFMCRLSSGFILALMFMFQKMGTTTFTLLNCVPVEDTTVLFIDGSVTCYQYWQYGVMAYCISCFTPFFIVLMVGPSLLYHGHISLPQFFTACVFPLPFLNWWLIKRMRHPKATKRHPRHLSESSRAVIQILQGPFTESKYGICWAGVAIGRRLVLILLFTFVNDSLIRLLCMLLSCFVILLHHVHVQPYKDKRGNFAGTASASALVTLAIINLVRAGFEAAEYTPTGPNAFLMKVFSEIENVLLLWLPLATIGVVALLFITRLFTVIARAMSRDTQVPRTPHEAHPFTTIRTDEKGHSP